MEYFVLKFVFWCLIIFGITQIVVEAEIFESPRRWLLKRVNILGKLVTCVLCTSVWVSFLISFFIFSPSEILFFYDIVDLNRMNVLNGVFLYKFIFMFLDGMVGSTIIWFMHIIETKLLSLPKEEHIYKQQVIDNATVEE